MLVKLLAREVNVSVTDPRLVLGFTNDALVLILTFAANPRMRRLARVVLIPDAVPFCTSVVVVLARTENMSIVALKKLIPKMPRAPFTPMATPCACVAREMTDHVAGSA
jgi:hypothetical protein